MIICRRNTRDPLCLAGQLYQRLTRQNVDIAVQCARDCKWGSVCRGSAKTGMIGDDRVIGTRQSCDRKERPLPEARTYARNTIPMPTINELPSIASQTGHVYLIFKSCQSTRRDLTHLAISRHSRKPLVLFEFSCFRFV